MPRSLRPTSAATSACRASCKTVAKCRTIRQPNGVQVTNNAAMPTARTQLWGRGGCTVVARCHNSSNTRPLIAEYSDQTLSSMPKWCYLLWCTKHFERNPAMTTEPDLVLTIAGLAIIAVTVGLLIWGRVSPVVAMALVPTVGAIVLGFGVGDLQSFFSSGLDQVMNVVVMFIFAIIFFGILSDAGLFDPVIRRLILMTRGRVILVVIGTVLIGALAHLDGAGATTFLLTIPALLPLYRALEMNRYLLLLLVSLSAALMNMVPWGGPLIRAASVIDVEPGE